MKSKLQTAIFLFLLLFCFEVFSQGTSCATAETIFINGACDSGTITDTSEDNPFIGSCPGTFNREGWYTFTVAGGPQNVTITAIGNNRNIYLQLLSSTSSCTGLTQINCANTTTTNGTQTETISTTLSNGIYYIKVVNVGSNGNLTLTSLCVTSTSPPVNSSCATATSLPCGTTNLAGTTVNTSGSSAHGTGCSMSNYGVWYTFTGDGQQTTISTNPAFDIKLSIVTGSSCGTFTNIACTDTSPETATFTSVAGTTYYVYIAHWSTTGSTTGTFTISRTCTPAPAPPPNATCSTATSLPCGTTNLAGTTVNTSGSSAHGTGCSMSNYGVWYTFTGDGQQTTISTNPAFDIKLSIVTGSSCGTFTNIACTDTSPETATFTTVAGTTYYVYIAHWSTTGSTTGTFTISRTCTPAPAPPPNATCSTATSLPCGTTNLAGTTVNTSGSSAHGTGCSMSNYGVWYTFTGDGQQTTISTNPAFDIQLSIVTGSSCGTFTNIACTDTSPETATFTTVAGTTYYVYIAHWSTTGSTTGTFTISRSCSVPYNPCTLISNIATCGSANNVTIPAGAGGYSPSSCGYNTPGVERIYTFTPASTGNFTITQTSSFGFIDYQFKPVSLGCSSSGWTCIDDLSGAGSSPSFTLIAGTQYYILLDPEVSTGGSVNFTINCPPSCPTPANLYATILSTTSVTVNWPITTPPSSGGYQYFINTTGTAPITGTTPTGSTAAGVTSVTLTGLTPGQKYFIWVRSFCGGSDTSSWFGPTNYTPCAVGNGTGTTTLACPSVVSGGLGLNGGNPATMSCQALGCVDLEATYLQLNQPTNYSVAPIPYAPPYQFTCLQNPVSVNIDDRWSPTINLPFDFCFYGNNYNKCLIGSNGVITFDTTTNTPGGTSTFVINNDLPNVALFKNTIFGVYHDIDPSKGGQVGWELITLNTGCRALVASWNNIPMYDCNSILYTGMIVLYENTNVIEVHIKEKNVCSTWNGGNAIVGIQNADGTNAVVATDRNGLSADWTETNKAWRFTPTGTTLTTLKWFEGNGTSGTQLGTTDSINVCPTVTTTYTAEVTYALCNGTNLKYTDNVVVNINGNKIWNGGTNTNWNEGSNWTPSGVPTSANCVVIPDVANDPIISNTPNALGHNLSVHNNAQLTMNDSQNLIITDKITVQPNAIFTVNNNANLIQINDSAVNTGSIRYKRIAPNIRGYDYVYWSSPVNNQDIGTIYDSTFPYNSGFKYQWNTTLDNTNGASGNISQGQWETASGTMTMGRGYIIRGSSSFGMPASNIPTTFTGRPFNGAIPYTVYRGSYTGAPYNGTNGIQITNLDDNFNLIGNPYPSSINALKFLQTNAYASTNLTGQIKGYVELWTHGTNPVLGATNPFYGSFLYNYDADDYLKINYLGATNPGSADLIRAGQAFFVQMEDGAAGSGTVNFNNSMRYDATFAPYSNSGFFKNANIANSEFSIERHRLWLDLVDSNSQSSRILVGYAANATNEYDNLFDAPTVIPSGLKLFSTITNDTNVFEIQGRSLPFDINDEIPIGINVPTQGNYSFAIGALDGLFEDQNIYLKDTMSNIMHDLKSNPYTFTTSAGVTLDRFKIVYINNALGNPNYSIDNAIKVLVNNEVAVSSSNLQMESIEVFNVLGQKLQTHYNINGNYFTLLNLHKNNTTLLLRIKLQTGETVIEKIIY